MKELKKLRYDVVCAGGGAGGVFAATAAARQGARTLLLERTGLLGGSAVLGLPLYGLATPVTALQEEFLSILRRLNGLAEPQKGAALCANGETVKLAFHRLCRDNGVDVLLCSEANEIQLCEERVCGVSALGKDTWVDVECEAAIDCTGTGDLVRSVGMLHQDPLLSACAVMILTGLDPKVLCQNGTGTAEVGFAAGQPGTCYRGTLMKNGPICTVHVCVEPHRFLVQIPLACSVNPSDPASRTQAAVLANREALALLRSLEIEPAFSNVRLSHVPVQMQLCGAPMVHASDLSCSSEQAVAADIDSSGAKRWFGIKHLALNKPAGLLVCGALAGPDCGTGSALATGEAAGACAACAVQLGCSPAQVGAQQVRDATGWMSKLVVGM